jgi:hypothetical protein
VSAGIGAGLVAAIPAFVLLLVTGMSGDGGYAAVALILPPAVGLVTWLLVRLSGPANPT